jgi:hypothetical protein
MNLKSAAVTLATALVLHAAGQAQERQMGVRQTPDAVFTAPVDTVLPELAGATATGENGRVGGELVFWGYRLGDGRPVFMFACALVDEVNCDERVQRICVDRTEVLRNTTVGGEVTRRVCRNMAVVAPGDTRPGCVDNEQTTDLAVGLVSCG